MGTPSNATANQSIERAARLLGLFTREAPELSLSQMSARLDVSRATAHRYASALRAAGLLRLTPSGYSLGPRLVELASTALAGLTVVSIAGPFLQRLVAEVDETAVLSVWDGDAPIVMLANDDTDHVVRINVRAGSRLAPDSAQGMVFRAFPPISDPSLAEVARRGLAVSGGSVEGIDALAAPVFQADGVAATLALVGTSARIAAGADAQLADALRACAGELSAALGRAG